MSPRVPTYDGRKVSSAALPGVRVDAALPIGAFDTSGSVPNAAPLQQAVSDLYQRARAKANATAVLDADTALGRLGERLRVDPEIGYQSRRGKDAASALDDIPDEWEKGVSEIKQSLHNDQQRGAFEQHLAQRSEQFNRDLHSHVSRQIEAHHVQALDSALTLSRNEAIAGAGDPVRIEQAIAATRSKVRLAAEMFGWGKEQLDSEMATRVSAIHRGVIETQATAGADLVATNYLNAHLTELAGDDLVHVQRTLEVSSARGESQRQADSILKTAPSFDAARAEAAKIEDPRVRELTEDRIRREFLDRAANDRQARDAAFQRAGDVLERTRDVHKIAPADWLQLSVEERATLHRRETQIRHPERLTDPDTFYSLMNMAGLSDASRQAFEQIDLRQYRDVLSERDYRTLANRQLTSRRQTQGAVSGEAKRQAAEAEKASKKAAERAAAMETLRALGIDVPAAVPGAPLRPQAQPRAGTNTTSEQPAGVPQAWIDRARRDQNYRLYLEHMGIKVPP